MSRIYLKKAQLTPKSNASEVHETVKNILTDIEAGGCLLYTSPSPRDAHESRMPSSA